MQYRIADVTIHTEIALPSFERFASEEGGAGGAFYVRKRIKKKNNG